MLALCLCRNDKEPDGEAAAEQDSVAGVAECAADVLEVQDPEPLLAEAVHRVDAPSDSSEEQFVYALSDLFG